jgi:hypothetical protein
MERYKLIGGGKMLEVMISVDDPAPSRRRGLRYNGCGAWRAKWSEDICAENNFNFLRYEVVPLP